MQLQISSRRETGKEIPESSQLEFLEKFLANNFALSDAEDNTPGLLNRQGIADLPLLRTLLAIHQKFPEQSFWEVVDSFVLLAYASLSASRTLLQRLLACLYINPTLNFSQNSIVAAEALILKIFSCGTSLKWSWIPSQSAQE